MHDISVNVAPHLTKSRPISHLVDIYPTQHISRSQKTHFYDVRASPKGFSPVLLLTDITHTAPARHMHKVLLMHLAATKRFAQAQDKATAASHDGMGQSIAPHAAMTGCHELKSRQSIEPTFLVDAQPPSAARARRKRSAQWQPCASVHTSACAPGGCQKPMPRRPSSVLRHRHAAQSQYRPLRHLPCTAAAAGAPNSSCRSAAPLCCCRHGWTATWKSSEV